MCSSPRLANHEVFVRVAIFGLVLVLAPGCTYLEDRALDLTDIIDLRYGLSAGLAGVKAEVTDYVGAGAGLGVTLWGQEWYGRRVLDDPPGGEEPAR